MIRVFEFSLPERWIRTLGRMRRESPRDVVINFQTRQGYQSRGSFTRVFATDNSIDNVELTQNNAQNNDRIEQSKLSFLYLILSPSLD